MMLEIMRMNKTMLITPLGIIEVFIDDRKYDYEYEPISLDDCCPSLNGRYKIKVSFMPDGKKHTIACRIKDYSPTKEDSINPGERLELKSFYKGKTKLDIGMSGDIGGLEYYGVKNAEFDYENEYLDDGVEYIVLKVTKTKEYIFGCAWIDNYNDDNEVQSWFGADPFMMKQ